VNAAGAQAAANRPQVTPITLRKIDLL
jgi:hypothetical protein